MMQLMVDDAVLFVFVNDAIVVMMDDVDYYQLAIVC